MEFPCPSPWIPVESIKAHGHEPRAVWLASRVLNDLLTEARSRVERDQSVDDPGAVRILWVNPIADLRASNRLEALMETARSRRTP